ncbi:MAG: MFS transporter [Myxococcaceae bacterium]
MARSPNTEGENAETAPLVAQGRARWLNRSVLGIGIASLLSDVGHEMATAVLPLLVVTLGGASAALGLIEGFADAASSFAKLLSGLYSDRLKRRKPLAVVGYFLTASGMASFALATQTWQLLVGRVIGWIGRGARTPVRNVLLTEATTPETYGRAFGLERTMDSAGAVIGPLLALALVGAIGVRPTLSLTLVPGVLAALAIAWLVRERPHAPPRSRTLWASLQTFSVPYRRFLFGVGIAGLGDFSNTLLILWATQAWTPRLGVVTAARWAMVFYVGYNVVYTLSCFVAGALADAFPKVYVLATGYLLAALPAAVLILPGSSFGKFAAVFGLAGVYMGFWETVEGSAAAEMLSPEERGVGFGVLATVNGVGDLFSSVLVGLLWTVSPRIAMSAVILLCLLGALVVSRSRARKTP